MIEGFSENQAEDGRTTNFKSLVGKTKVCIKADLSEEGNSQAPSIDNAMYLPTK